MTQTDNAVQPGLRFPKDVRIEQVALITHTGKGFDLYNMFSEINIYEDIFTNTLSGDIVFDESLNLPANVPLIGQEKLVVSYFVPGRENSRVDAIFNIYKISDRAPDHDKRQIYALYFCAPELVTDKLKKISKSFRGTHTDIIQRVVQEQYGLDSSKPLFIEKSKYETAVVSPRWSPFQLINWLTTRAVSASSNNADYLFYETPRGLFCRSLTDLISEGLNQSQRKLFTYRPTGHHNLEPGKNRYRIMGAKDNQLGDEISIETYTIKSGFDTLNNIESGLFAGRIIEHDIVNKRLTESTFNYFEHFADTDNLEDNEIITNQPNLDQQLFTDFTNSNLNIVPNHPGAFSNIPDHKRYKQWLLQRQSEMVTYNNIVVEIIVPGDNDIQVGDVVDIILPSQEPMTEEFIEDKLYSGKYMVTSIRHRIRHDNFVQVIELSKDSLFKKIEESQYD